MRVEVEWLVVFGVEYSFGTLLVLMKQAKVVCLVYGCGLVGEVGVVARRVHLGWQEVLNSCLLRVRLIAHYVLQDHSALL